MPQVQWEQWNGIASTVDTWQDCRAGAWCQGNPFVGFYTIETCENRVSNNVRLNLNSVQIDINHNQELPWKKVIRDNGKFFHNMSVLDCWKSSI